MEQIFIGIDVSQDRLDAHVRPSDQSFAVARDSEGLAALVERLKAFDPYLVVLEATGGFEVTVAAAVVAAQIPLAVVNPRQIRDFARATGQLAKTDALDAKAIARFAESVADVAAVSDRVVLVMPPLAPYAGTAPTEPFDVGPYCIAIHGASARRAGARTGAVDRRWTNR